MLKNFKLHYYNDFSKYIQMLIPYKDHVTCDLIAIYTADPEEFAEEFLTLFELEPFASRFKEIPTVENGPQPG